MGPATLNRPLSDEEMDELERQSATSADGFVASAPPTDRPLTDAELDAVEMRDGAGTALQQTPFGQATDPAAPKPETTQRPLSDRELDDLQDETVRNPSYIPTFDEWDDWDRKRAARSNKVQGFLRGAGSIAQALGGVAYSVAATPGNFVMRGFGPAYDTLVHSSAEGMRRAGVGIAEMITWAGDTAADIRTSTEREAALDGQLRRQMAEQNAFTGNAQADAQIFAQAKEKARSEGFYDLTQGQKSEDRREEYDRFVRGRALEQEFLGIGDYTMGTEAVPTGNIFGPKFVGGEPIQVQGEAATKRMYGVDDSKVDEGIATGVMIAGDFTNVLPLGAGALNKVKALRRLAVLADRPMGWTAGALGKFARLAEDIEAKATGAGFTTDRLAKASGAVAIGAGAFGVSQNNDLAKGIAAAATVLPTIKYGGKILRRAEGAALAGQMVAKEMGVGGVGVLRADSASRLAENAAIPGRYRDAMRGFFAGPESSLKRASQNEALPLSARQTMARLDRAGATQAFRVADDAVSGALAGTVVGAPFAAIAPEDKQAEIFGSIATMGALGGAVSGPLARRAQMADADVARMLADVEAVGGDAATLAQLPHDKLVRLAAMQGVVSSKVDFVPLRADEYAANDVLNAKNATTTKGLYIDAEDGNRPRIFINIDQLAAGDVGGHEIGHAILKSDILGGEIKNNMRNLVNVQYGQDGVVARGREYATKLLADQVEQGVTGIKPEVLTDAEMQRVARGAKPEDIIRERWQDPAMRERMINERIDEMNQRDMVNGGMEFDWARDEIAAETFSGLSGGIDFRNIRQSGPMAAALGAFSGTLDMMGARFRGNGRLETPNRLFEENPLMDTPQMRKAVTDYTKAFDRYLAGMERESAPKPRGTKVAPTGKASEAARSAHNRVYQNGNVTENDIFVVDANGNQIPKSQQQIDTQERARAATLKSINKRDRLVPTHSNEWGARKVGNRTEVGGPNLPMQFDHFVQVPEWLRTKAREFEAGRRNGQSYRISYNAIGTGVSGSYKIKNLGNVEAITREIVPYGWQLSDKNHLLAKAIDLDAFRAAAIRAVDRGELPEFGNNVKQVEADLKVLLKNYEDGLPGETNLGVLKKNILNGLLGTGTAVQKAANPLYAELNPKGSIRTFRFDRLNYADPYATGYFPHYHKINTNALPREAGVMSLDEWRQFDADRKSVWLNSRAREAGFTNGENWRNADPAGFSAADARYRNEFPVPAQGGVAALPGDAKKAPKFAADKVVKDEGGAVWRTLQDAPVITLKDLKGRKVFAAFADLTSAGKIYRGIDSSEIAVPVETHGGPEWPLLQAEKVGDETNVWSNQGAGVSAIKARRASEGAIMLIAAMDKNAHVSNTETATAVIATNAAYARDGRITPENLAALDNSIRKEIEDFPGIESPGIMEYVNKLPFQGKKSRARIAEILESKEAQNRGAANVQRILDEMRSDQYDGLRIGDAVLAIELTPGATAVKLGEQGTLKHPSYQYALRGRVIGRFARPINISSIFDDFYAQRRADGKPELGDRRAFDLAKPVQEITDDIASRIPGTPYNSFRSPRHAQLINMAKGDKWRSSEQTVKAGGVSPAAFIDALNASPAKLALDRYTLKSLQEKLEAREMSIHQLGDAQVFFGIKQGDPASAYGQDPAAFGFGPGEKTLSLVLNNERKTGGMADAIVVKSLQFGVTALDCFAVKSKKNPTGMLPELYENYGFEPVGTIPFDPQFYSKTELADLKKYWKSIGWDDSLGLPEIVLMKWKGNDELRTKSLREFAEENSASVQEAVGGRELYTDTRKLAERNAGKGGKAKRRAGQSDAGSSAGNQGDAGRGVRLSRGFLGAYDELLSLSPDELRNLGIK